MTPTEQIERLRQLEKAATPRPWSWGIVDSVQLGSEGIVNEPEKVVVFCNSGRGSGEPSEEDHQLISAARNSLPALLDVASAAAEIEAARSTLNLECLLGACDVLRAALSRLGDVKP